MADIYELLDIADEAKAEGDEETYKAVMAELDQTKGPHHPPGTPLYRPEGSPELGQAMPKGPAFTDRGLRAAGVGATRALLGPGQAVTALAETVPKLAGANPLAGATKNYTEAANQLASDIWMGGEPLKKNEEPAALVGEIGAGLAVPAGVVRGAATKAGSVFTKMKEVLKAAFPGAMVGAGLNFDPKADSSAVNLSNRTLGAVVGGAAGAAAGSSKQAVYNTARRKMMVQDPGTAGTMAQVTEEVDKGARRTLAMTQGTELAKRVESQVAGQKAKEVYNSIYESVANRFRSQFPGKQLPPGQLPVRSINDTAFTIGEEIRKAEAKAQAVATRQFDEGMNEAYTLAQTTARNVQGRVPETYALMVDFKSRHPNVWQQLVDDTSVVHRAKIDKAVEILKRADTSGTLPVTDIMDLYSGASILTNAARRAYRQGQAPSPAASTAYRFGKDIMRAIDGEMDQVQLAAPEVAPVWRKFNETRSNYRAYGQARRQFEATAVKQIFGMIPKDPAEAVMALGRADPVEQRKAVELLRTTEDGREALEEVRNFLTNRAVQDAYTPGRGADVSKFDPEKFIETLMDGNNLRYAGLFTAQDRAKIHSAVSAAQLVLTKPPPTRRLVELEGLSMALASRSTAFLARHLFRAIGSGKAEEVIFSPEGQKALTELRNLWTDGKPVSAATASWLAVQAGETAQDKVLNR